MREECAEHVSTLSRRRSTKKPEIWYRKPQNLLSLHVVPKSIYKTLINFYVVCQSQEWQHTLHTWRLVSWMPQFLQSPESFSIPLRPFQHHKKVKWLISEPFGCVKCNLDMRASALIKPSCFAYLCVPCPIVRVIFVKKCVKIPSIFIAAQSFKASQPRRKRETKLKSEALSNK